MTEWLQPLATALAGAAAIATVTWTVTRDRHPLALVERLTMIATNIRLDAVRRLVEDERDERALRWVLERRAPADARARIVGHCLLGIGLTALLVWLVGAIVDRWAVWAWISYVVGLGAVVAARAVLAGRASRRDEWMVQERSWRKLPQASRAERVPKKQE